VLLWDARTGAQLPTLPVGGELVMTLAFTRDGRRLAGATESGVRVWDVKSGKPVAEPAEAHRGRVTQVGFSAEPGVVVTAAWDNTVRFWDAARGRQRRALHVGPLTTFALSPDGRRLVTASDDDTVRLWDAVTGRQRFKLYGHGMSGVQARVHFFPDGERFASFGHDRYLRVWRAANGKALLEHPIHAGGLGPFSEDDALDERERALAEQKALETGRPIFTPDGKRMVLPVGRGLYVLDVDSGKEVRKLAPDGGPVDGLAISPDGRWLLTGTLNVLHLWALDVGRRVRQIPLTDPLADVVVFSPTGRFFATGTTMPGFAIHVYETASGEVVRTFTGFPAAVRDLAFSRDGRLLASAFDDTTVLIWDLTRTVAQR
jgi:WD40 repeat protein